MHSWYVTLRNARKLQQLLDVSVDGEDERGLLGIAVSKNSTVGKTYVFLFYTEAGRSTQVDEGEDGNGEEQTSNGDGGQPIGNRLYRYELSGKGSKLVNPTLLLDLPITLGGFPSPLYFSVVESLPDLKV